MSKITLNNVRSLASWTTAGSTIDNNSAVVQTAFDNTLSRDGTSPNYMSSQLDMNSNQIINLPAPLTPNSPVRLTDIQISSPTNIQNFDTKVAAASSTIPVTTSYVRTAGYSLVGDGGGALYAKVNTIIYPTYSFTDVSGLHWQYVPEPSGWNAMVAGVVADGVTDDAINLNNALKPFCNSTFIAGGGNLTGTLLLPPKVMRCNSLVVYVGSNSSSINILGHSANNQGGPVSTCLQWGGVVNYPSMFMLYGSNNALIDGVNFDGVSFGTGLVNCVHQNADNMINTTLTTSPVSAGVGRTFNCTTTNIQTGAALGVGAGTANFEIVYVSSVGGSSFVATCVNNHSLGEQIGKGPPTNANVFQRCTFSVPGGATSTGMLCGNFITSTVQVSDFEFHDCNFVGTGTPGTSYSGMRTVVGGNIKNYLLNNCVFIGFAKGIAGEAFSGSVHILYPTFANTTIVDILANGASNIYIDNYESESNGQAMLIGSGGANAQGATIIQSTYQSGIPTDFYVIKWFGNLTLINNTFFSQASSGPTFQVAPRIQNGGISNGSASTLVPSATTSIGNYFQWGDPNVPVFYDGSNNPIDYGDFSVASQSRLFQVNDYGDTGQYPQRIGDLSCISSAMSLQNVSPGVNVVNSGLVSEVTHSITIPYTAFQTGSTSKMLTLWSTPPRTKITGVIADVTAAFGGTAGTLNMVVGDNVNATNEFLLTFDVKSAPITRGLINADLGAALNSATIPTLDGYCQGWVGGDQVTVTLSSSSGNLSGLTVGSVTIYLTCKRFR